MNKTNTPLFFIPIITSIIFMIAFLKISKTAILSKNNFHCVLNKTCPENFYASNKNEYDDLLALFYNSYELNSKIDVEETNKQLIFTFNFQDLWKWSVVLNKIEHNFSLAEIKGKEAYTQAINCVRNN